MSGSQARVTIGFIALTVLGPFAAAQAQVVPRAPLPGLFPRPPEPSPHPGALPQSFRTSLLCGVASGNGAHRSDPEALRRASETVRDRERQVARAAFRQALGRSPREALRTLANQGNVLDENERYRLGQEAVVRLRLDAGFIHNPWQALASVREAQIVAPWASAGLLADLRTDVERRCLEVALHELRPLIEARAWDRFARQAARLQGLERLGGVRQDLIELAWLAPRNEHLKRLELALDSPAQQAPVAWQRVSLSKLPAALRGQVAGLRALASLLPEAERQGPAPVDAESLKRALRELRAANVEQGVADRVELGLGARALLGGHPSAARQLLEDVRDNHGVKKDARAWLAVLVRQAEEECAWVEAPTKRPHELVRPATHQGPAELLRPLLRRQCVVVTASLGPTRQMARQQLDANWSRLRPYGLAPPAGGAGGGPAADFLGAPFALPGPDDDRKFLGRIEERLGWRLTAEEARDACSLRRFGEIEEEIVRHFQAN